MSLVNKLLKDLESRQSYLQDEPDLALDGLYSAYDVEIGHDVNKRKQFYFLAFAILILSIAGLLVWASIPDINDTFGKSDKDVQHESADSTPVLDNKSEVTNISESQNIQGKNSSFFSLKIDDLPSVKSTASAPETSDVNYLLMIKDINIEESGSNIILSFELPAELDYRTYTLDSPSRVVLEIQDIDYAGNLPLLETLPDIINIRKRIDKNGKFIFVMESKNPLAIVSAGYQKPDGKDMLQIVLHNSNNQTAPNTSTNISESIAPVQDDYSVLSKDTVMKGELVKTMNEPPIVSDIDKKLVKSQELYRQGQVAESLDLLYSVVKEDESNVQARATLALELLEQGQKELAVSLLQEGLQKFPKQSEWAKLLARIYIDEGNYTMARDVLGKEKPSISVDPEYHALYAAVLQKLSLHEEAALTYRDLVNINPTNGLWWMGLAISLEAISREKDAVFAYKNALNGQLLTPETHRYIIERIRYLDSKLNHESS